MKISTCLRAAGLLAAFYGVDSVAGQPVALAQAKTMQIAAQQNLAKGARVEVSSMLSEQYKADNVVDGQINNDSRWLSARENGPHTLTLRLAKTQRIGAIQLASGWQDGGKWNSAVRDFSIQIRSGGGWKILPEGAIVANDKPFVSVNLKNAVETDAVRFVIQDPGTVRVLEVRLYAPAPTYPMENLPVAGAEATVVVPVPPVFVNQSGYDLDGPKRFTAPTLPDDTAFVVKGVTTGKVVFRGAIRGGIGDFTALRPQNTAEEFVVVAGDLNSDAFRIAPFWVERVSLAPALHFMVDARSVVGTHPSAYGGMPWRDGTYYSYEVPSLVMLYQAAPDYFEQVPVEMSWLKDRARVEDADFKLVSAANDQGVLEAVRRYYAELDAPVGERVPDIIQLIHWGIGWHLMKPVSADPSGDSAGAKIHPQTVEQFAFFLAGYPQFKRYFTPAFYKKAHDFAFEQWPKVGLFDVITTFDAFKGRNAPGHSILPNLLMHRVALSEKRPEAEKYLQAAINEAKWVITLDPTNPDVTKGQRMSEHMTITGLTTLLRDYPQQAPAGIKPWLQKWADVMIARSNNEWDFRCYDDRNWSLPRFAPGSSGGAGWNEPGNLAGFPACALPIADILGQPTQAERLRQIATSQWDALYGRNPIGAHSAANGPQDWFGVERGWPNHFGNNVCARLELVRGTLNSSAATEQYPYNPRGAFRHPEGWTAFNAAFNVSLAYAISRQSEVTLWDANFRSQLGTTTGDKTIGVELVAPLSSPPQVTQSATVDVLLPDGSTQKLVLKRADTEGTRFRGPLSVPKGQIHISYGFANSQKMASCNVK